MIGLMVSDCEVFFLTYDEPEGDERWERVKILVPDAKRVNGVKGFDAAYKACANQSSTPRFFTIDGDNEILPSFVGLRLDFARFPEDAVLSWSAKNLVNGLDYGNGGIKNWPKRIVQSMKTHESAELESGAVDFCFQLTYQQMPDSLSEVKINGSPYQAFRSGFREGVKMCMERGIRPPFQGMSAPENVFHSHVAVNNLNRLKIWCSIGADVQNGLWAIYGARLGCQELCINDFKYELIRDYEWFERYWKEEIGPRFFRNEKWDESVLNEEINLLGERLNSHLKLGIVKLPADCSMFFKSVYLNPRRESLMFF